MATELDPLGAEPEALLEATDFSAKRVLEVGAGDGRLSYRLPGEARLAAGIDLNLEKITTANGARCSGIRPGLAFLAASVLALPFCCGSFDVVLLAWSL